MMLPLAARRDMSAVGQQRDPIGRLPAAAPAAAMVTASAALRT